MAEYIPSTREWVRDQVELYEGSGGKELSLIHISEPTRPY